MDSSSDLEEEIVVTPPQNMIANEPSSPLANSVIDADPTAPPPAKKQKRLQHDDWVRLPVVTDDLRDDLVDFGFSREKVQTLLNQRQRLFDPWKEGPTKEYRLQQARLAKEKNETATKRRKIMEKYEPLFLKEESDWAVFDPQVHSYPLITKGAVAPPMFKKYERFETGNVRIVEVNLNTSSVRIKSTPITLRNKRIAYDSTGPKIMTTEAEQAALRAMQPPPPKRRPGRPRKTAAPAFTPVIAPPPMRLSPVTRTSVKLVEAPRLREPVVKKEPHDDSGSDLSDVDEI